MENRPELEPLKSALKRAQEPAAPDPAALLEALRAIHRAPRMFLYDAYVIVGAQWEVKKVVASSFSDALRLCRERGITEQSIAQILNTKILVDIA